MAHPNADLLTRLDEAFDQGDFDTVLAAFADDCKVHIAGHSRMAGDYEGKGRFAELMGQYVGSLGDDPQMETHAILADDHHGVMLQAVHASKGDTAVDIRTVNVFHIDGGQITEMWSMDDDQAEADAFYDM